MPACQMPVASERQPGLCFRGEAPAAQQQHEARTAARDQSTPEARTTEQGVGDEARTTTR